MSGRALNNNRHAHALKPGKSSPIFSEISNLTKGGERYVAALKVGRLIAGR